MIRRILGVIRRYPSVGVSAAMIAVLIGLSIYTLIALPLPKALSMWRAERDVWKYTPANARPAWTNLLRQEKLPITFIIPTREADIVTEPLNETLSSQTMRLLFTYDNTHLPSEVVFFFNVRIGSKIPLLTIHWIRPDGMEVELRSGPANPGPARELIDPSAVFGAVDQHKLTIGTGSFGGDGDEEVLPGEHMLVIKALAFDEGFALDGELVVYGRVHGLAGTDTRRRDLTIGLLWGTPIALMFGLIAAVGTTLLGFVIAAVGAWYGGWIDAVIQRLTEINMMIPFLPTIMMVGWFFSSSLWILLTFIIGFSILTGRLKSYRAMFLQLIRAEYVEAARAYGASGPRIIFRYLIPRVFPVLLPHIILGVPMFVFLETSLAFIGISDPNLITWGSVLSDASGVLYMRSYYWILGPMLLLMFTGISFSVLGYTLERAFNPLLRDR